MFRTIKIDDKKSLTIRSDVVSLYGEFCCLLKYGLKERMYWGYKGSDLNQYDEDVEIVRVSQYFYYKPSEICEECKKTYNVERCCKCYDKNKTPIQIIYINPEKHKNVRSFVKTFDLDFCEVIFDGEKFEILKPESILNKTSTYTDKPNYTEESREKRKKKYRDRGFTINEE